VTGGTALAGAQALGPVSEEFRRFAAGKAAGYSPTYTALALHTAGQDELLESAAAAAGRGSTIPDIFLAAVQYLVRTRHDQSLLGLFDSGIPGQGTDEAIAAFDAFCRAHKDELSAVIAGTRLQTNEPARAAALLIGIAEAQARYGGPAWVVDLGSSAGLHLLLDQLDYAFDGGPGRVSGIQAPRRPGSARPPLLRTRLLNWQDRPLPETMPAIAGKTGIDLDPLDVTDPAAQRRLESYVWPEERERRAFMRAAVRLAARFPPDIRRGDAAALLPAVLAEIPGDGLICVVSSHAAGQFPATVTAAIDELTGPLVEAGRCARITLEGRAGGDLPAPKHHHGGGSYAQLKITGADGTVPVLLAGSHGGWIEAL
jgi:hypothetical protein